MIKTKAKVIKFENINVTIELSEPTVNSINKNNNNQAIIIGIMETIINNKDQKLFFDILNARAKEVSCCAAVAGNINETLTA